jgi:putative effector of murein hydrolase LrgA (UPF0299 family)
VGLFFVPELAERIRQSTRLRQAQLRIANRAIEALWLRDLAVGLGRLVTSREDRSHLHM